MAAKQRVSVIITLITNIITIIIIYIITRIITFAVIILFVAIIIIVVTMQCQTARPVFLTAAFFTLLQDTAEIMNRQSINGHTRS